MPRIEVEIIKPPLGAVGQALSADYDVMLRVSRYPGRLATWLLGRKPSMNMYYQHRHTWFDWFTEKAVPVELALDLDRWYEQELFRQRKAQISEVA